MAHVTKYRTTYCNPQGNEFELLIQENNWAGSISNVTAGPTPFVVHIENSRELKVGSICPTRATITLVSSETFNMDELYTTDEQKYKVIHRRTDGNMKGYWVGFVVPNGFSEELDTVVHYLEIQASDRLASLQGIKFLDENGLNYGEADGQFRRSFLSTIKEALKKTGLELPIYTMVDLRPLASAEPQQGGVFSREVYFYDTTNDTVAWNGVLGIQPPTGIVDSINTGDKIKVTGGINSGRTFTVDWWEVQGVGPTQIIYVYTLEAPTHTHPNKENVTLSIDKPAPPPLVGYNDPLDITFLDTRTFTDSSNNHRAANKNRVRFTKPKPYYEFQDGTMMSWDVLDSMATLWQSRIIQNQGRWEIRRVNVEALAAGTYQYFVYNSDGVYSGRELFGEDLVFDCKPNPLVYMPFGHTVSMDRVLKRVTTRYNFRYKQEGDSFENLIRDGNFAQLGTTNNEWAVNGGIQVQKITSGLPEDFQTGASLKGADNNSSIVNIVGNAISEVVKGDILTITFFERIVDATEPTAGVYGVTVSGINETDDSGERSTTNYYELVNSGNVTRLPGRPTDVVVGLDLSAEWEEVNRPRATSNKDRQRFFTPKMTEDSRWRKVTIITPAVPINGFLRVEAIGVATLTPNFWETLEQDAIVKGMIPKGGEDGGTRLAEFTQGNLLLMNHRTILPVLQLTGMFIKRLTSGGEAEADYIAYMNEQEGDYTDSIDDINIINSDELNEDMVGNIYVNIGGQLTQTNQWDTWATDFGWDQLGMVLSKSIVQLYQVPFRKIDGALVAPGLDLTSRVFLETTGGAKYILLRGSMDYMRNRFTGTLAQVANTDIPEDEGKDPIWELNGTIRCVVDVDTGVNTGKKEAMEVDVNRRSNTYLQFRWVELEDEDLEMCPIGVPTPLYWGAVPEGEVPDALNLNYFPVITLNDSYRVEYDNDGSGRYLMVYFFEGLGELQSVLEVENEESLSSWEPLPDTQINGITYKGYRMEHVTGSFTGHPKTFIIN